MNYHSATKSFFFPKRTFGGGAFFSPKHRFGRTLFLFFRLILVNPPAGPTMHGPLADAHAFRSYLSNRSFFSFSRLGFFLGRTTHRFLGYLCPFLTLSFLHKQAAAFATNGPLLKKHPPTSPATFKIPRTKKISLCCLRDAVLFFSSHRRVAVLRLGWLIFVFWRI